MTIFVHFNKPDQSYYAIIHRPGATPTVAEIPGARSWGEAERIMRQLHPTAAMG